MKTFLAVARREILEKRFVLWVALVVATQPFMVPIVRQLGGEKAREVRDMTALLLGLGVSAAIAAGLGSSIFAGELAAKRMGFFFSRPIPTSSLWAGKLAGAIALVTATALLVLGPVALVDRDKIVLKEAGIGLAAFAGGLLTLVLVMNFLSTMVRSRSWVAFVDLGAVLVIGVALELAWTRLRRWRFEPPPALIWIVGIAIVAALLWSSYRAVARGRTDVRPAHAAMSASLWAVLGGIAAALVGYSAWVLSPPPSAFVSLGASPVASEGWVFLAGRPRGVNAGVLYDTRSSRFERLPADDVSVSGDGRFAAWVERNDPGSSRFTLFTRRLDDPKARPLETKVSFSSGPFPLVLSPDGSRVAAVETGLLTVSEIATGRTLASARIGQTAGWRTGWFVGGDRVRILRIGDPSGPKPVESIDLDLANRGPAAIHSTPAPGGALMAVSRAGDSVILREGEGPLRRFTIRNAATLEEIATLRKGPAILRSARFLADGSIVMAIADAGGAWIDAFSAQGVRTAHVRLGAGSIVYLGEQPDQGRIFASFRAGNPSPSPSEPSRLFVVDLRSGTAAEVARGLHPLWAGWWYPRTQLGRPGSESARLFGDDAGGLVRFDPATGERRVLLGSH